MEPNELLTVEQVALQLGVAATTINLWYKWKHRDPSHPMAALLHDPVKIHKRRYWKQSDVDDMKIFNVSKPTGRGGLFADITYRRNKYENNK